MSIESVLLIASQLAAEGKQPSVALIKSRLPTPCPMPVVIQALQRWRSQQSGSPTPPEIALSANNDSSSAWPDNWAEAKAEVLLRMQQQEAEMHALRDTVARLQAEIRKLLAAAGET